MSRAHRGDAVSLTPIGGPARSSRRARLAVTSLLPLCLLGLLATACGPPGAPGLEVLPKHFLLHPGEQIHYQVLERSENGRLRSVDYEFAIKDSGIVRPIEPKGVL